MEKAERFAASLTDQGRFQILVEGITDYAIYMLDLTGVVSSWNRGAQRFKGYREAEIIGQHFSRFYTEEDQQAGIPALALKTAAEEGRFEAEGWRVRKDGSRFWAHVIIDAIHDQSGRLIGFAKITRDLTDKKRAEEALRRSEERFRLLVQSVTDYAIYMLDPEGRVSNWNAGAEKIKGFGADEITGQHFSRFYTEEDRQAGIPALALKTAAEEGRFEAEGWRVRKDGSRFWANVIIDPIRDDKGRVIGFAKVTRDISERREAQLALEQAREALFQSQKMEAIGQLAGGIAHDFNNLLTAVLGSLELLRKRMPGDPKLMNLVDNAMQGTRRGAALTQRLLAFGRRQMLMLEPVDVPALVHGMSDLLQRSLGPTVTIETRFPLGLALAHADANQLELALLNLAVNARDAMPHGGTIVIGASTRDVARDSRQTLGPGRYVCLTVTDTGEGMDAATLTRATEPFFTTKGVGKGTGLGLSMVHGLAEQSGGRLVLKSQLGEGTTAELWLPVANVNSAALPRDNETAEDEPRRGTRPLRVLIVDDDSLVLMNTVAMLDDLGHSALEANSGAQALELLRREKMVDLVITDQLMPRMTGTQLAEAIRAEWPNLPILLATGHAELPSGTETDLPRLAKPFRQKDLAEAITKTLDSEQAQSRVLKFRAQ